MTDPFVVGTSDRGIWLAKETSDEGPLCECNRLCRERLPVGAWRHVGVAGQYVVLPEHVEEGERMVSFEGWCVVEGEF